MSRPRRGGGLGRGRGPSAPATVPTARPYVAKIRRSHVASTFGPGAIVDVRTTKGAPISGVLAGLEEWDFVAPAGQQGLLHFQRTSEPRLQRALHVRGFRLPPVHECDDERDDVLPIVRFPGWLVCPGPNCERLARADEFSFDPGAPERFCAACTRTDRVHAVPVRFIVACEDGHLDEFPWQIWIGCTCDQPRLRLRTAGAGLAGKIISCSNGGCPSRARSLEGAFSRMALTDRGLRCRGLRPWLRSASPDPCGRTPRVLQRGASSTYFSVIESALSIPPFSADLSGVIGHYWEDLEQTAPSDWPDFIRLNRLEEKTRLPASVLLTRFRMWLEAVTAQAADASLEWPEYLQLVASGHAAVSEGQYETRPEHVPPELSQHISSVVLAQRLREVRALVAFTRINPPTGPFRDPVARMGRLYATAQEWLPAIELRGEGIFIGFDNDAIRRWESLACVIERMQVLQSRRTRPDPDPVEEQRKCSPRFVMIHTFSHMLMRQLSFECGYSSAALRERLYADPGDRNMCGILVHTGSPDSEGTLGGLVRQGKEELLEATVRAMLMSASWCSSDPLCITGAVTLSSPDNLAACHACVLVPETSCQHFNHLLDRGLIVGVPDSPTTGFFGELISELIV